MHKGVIIGIIAVVVAIGGFLASPLFYETEVNEPLPVALNEIEEGLTFEKFVEMDDEKRKILVQKIPQEVEDMIMEKAAMVVVSVSESMDEMTQDSDSAFTLLKSGMFEGLAGHNAEGIAKAIQINGKTFLRFENFQVTNGPDLRVYITPDGDVKNGIHLEKLKGSKGDQNYLLENIDVEVCDIVVIYCQPFSAYFGQAELL